MEQGFLEIALYNILHTYIHIYIYTYCRYDVIYVYVLYIHRQWCMYPSTHNYKILVLCRSVDIYVKAHLPAGKIKSSLSPVRTGSFTPQFKGSKLADSEGNPSSHVTRRGFLNSPPPPSAPFVSKWALTSNVAGKVSLWIHPKNLLPMMDQWECYKIIFESA